MNEERGIASASHRAAYGTGTALPVRRPRSRPRQQTPWNGLRPATGGVPLPGARSDPREGKARSASGGCSHPRDPHGHAAADIEHLPRDEAAARIEQVRHGVRHILGRAHALHGHRIDDGLRARRIRWVGAVEQLGADGPRPDGVGRDAVAPQLQRPYARHADQAGLGGRVRGAQLLAQGSARGHVHDAPEAGRLHARQQRLHALQAAAQVQRYGQVELLQRLLGRPGRHHDADVVDQPRDRATRQRLLQRARRLGWVGQVGLDATGHMIDHAVDDDRLVAVGAAAFCRRRTDAGAAAGDEDALAHGGGKGVRHGESFRGIGHAAPQRTAHR